MSDTLSIHERRLAKAREYKVKHREAVLAKNREYNRNRLADPVRKAAYLEQTKRSKAKLEYKEKWHQYDKERDPVKVAARNKIRGLISDGRLIRGKCVICDKPEAQAHHEDYSKPFEIYWLCPSHHNEAHKDSSLLHGKESTTVK